VLKYWGFVKWANTHWTRSHLHQFMCKHKLSASSLTHPNFFLKVSNKRMNLLAGRVMEGCMVFCQKNILEHSMSFHGNFIKRCLLAHRVSQILYLTKIISEIKYQMDFLLHKCYYSECRYAECSGAIRTAKRGLAWTFSQTF
jgi:hypothetical protein